jgi:hypothetical protein
MSCTRATYAAPSTVTAHVQVYGGGGGVCGGAAPSTYAFCQSCPGALDGEEPWTTTLIETACSESAARQGAQSMGTNCALSDGPCS